MTEITWLGHACFKISDGYTSLVFDPYAPGSVPGLTLPLLKADAVICSHGHRDHNYAKGVELTLRPLAAKLTHYACWHDHHKGEKRGQNLMTCADFGGVRVCHCGDLGHEPDYSKLPAGFFGADFLLIPVGGYYTIDAAEAFRVCSALKPKHIIPMHYSGEGFGYDVLAPLKDFTSLFPAGDVAALNCSSFSTDYCPSAQVLCLSLQG